MALELSPEIESAVRDYAAAEGVSISEAIARRFPPRLRPVPPDDPVLQFLNNQLREAENATPEEQAAADAEWLDFRRAMNGNRAEGERLLYPEVAP